MHGALSEVCGEFSVDRSTVSRWTNRFRGGCVSIDSDPRPGRPRTSKDEGSVKLVADALEEDRREHVKNFLEQQEKKFEEKCTRTDLSCSWLSHSFSMTMLARTSGML